MSGALPIQNGLKEGDALSPLLLNCAVEYDIKMGKGKEGSELNGTYQLLVYADNVNILGKNKNTIKKNTETLLAFTIWTYRILQGEGLRV
jgi:hypothetical protein